MYAMAPWMMWELFKRVCCHFMFLMCQLPPQLTQEAGHDEPQGLGQNGEDLRNEGKLMIGWVAELKGHSCEFIQPIPQTATQSYGVMCIASGHGLLPPPSPPAPGPGTQLQQSTAPAPKNAPRRAGRSDPSSGSVAGPCTLQPRDVEHGSAL